MTYLLCTAKFLYDIVELGEVCSLWRGCVYFLAKKCAISGEKISICFNSYNKVGDRIWDF